jgi:hypothetical protein
VTGFFAAPFARPHREGLVVVVLPVLPVLLLVVAPRPPRPLPLPILLVVVVVAVVVVAVVVVAVAVAVAANPRAERLRIVATSNTRRLTPQDPQRAHRVRPRLVGTRRDEYRLTSDVRPGAAVLWGGARAGGGDMAYDAWSLALFFTPSRYLYGHSGPGYGQTVSVSFHLVKKRRVAPGPA